MYQVLEVEEVQLRGVLQELGVELLLRVEHLQKVVQVLEQERLLNLRNQQNQDQEHLLDPHLVRQV